MAQLNAKALFQQNEVDATKERGKVGPWTFRNYILLLSSGHSKLCYEHGTPERGDRAHQSVEIGIFCALLSKL